MNPAPHTDKQTKPRFLPRGLSGKLLVLTMVVIMATEIFVFVPSVANFRLTWLANHFVTGEATSLALEKLPDKDIPDNVRNQLLSLTQTEVIVVRREGASRVLATKEMPGEVARHVQLRKPGRKQALRSITEAFDTLINGRRPDNTFVWTNATPGRHPGIVDERKTPARCHVKLCGECVVDIIGNFNIYRPCRISDSAPATYPPDATHEPHHAGICRRSRRRLFGY